MRGQIFRLWWLACCLLSALTFVPASWAGGVPVALTTGLGGAGRLDARADGALLVTQPAANEVVQISPSGEMTVVAGTGVAGSEGDGGPAANAQLNRPEGVAWTADGGFVIADGGN